MHIVIQMLFWGGGVGIIIGFYVFLFEIEMPMYIRWLAGGTFLLLCGVALSTIKG